MRRLISCVAISVCMLGLYVPAAQAADRTITVHGQDLAGAGLAYNSGLCDQWTDDPLNNGPSNVYALYKKPGLIGKRAIGWQFGASGGELNSEAGPLAYVASPRSLTNVHFSGYMKSKDNESGDLIAYLAPTGDFRDGYYAGSHKLGQSFAGWSTWNHLSDLTLTWRHWANGAWATDPPPSTIQDLAQSSGSAATAYIGVELGCKGQSWYVDDFRVATTSGKRTYDFEGLRTGTVFGGWHKLTDPTKKIVWGLKHFTRNYGETDAVVGYGGYVNDLPGAHDVGDFVFFKGPGSLYAKPYGAKRFHKVGTKNFTVKGSAVFRLRHLKKHTAYYFAYPGNTALAGSRSQTMTVDVRAELHGHLVNKTVYRGARLTVSGERLPGDSGVRILLQRKIRGHWHTIGAGRTHRHGTFRVSARAGSLGTWHLRLAMPQAKGNLGNTTRAFDLHIKRHPAPPSPPVITTPPPCTTCAGRPPDVPVGKVGKVDKLGRLAQVEKAGVGLPGVAPRRMPSRPAPGW